MSRSAGIYAIFETTEGAFVVRFFDQEAPNTVANFVGLAEGTKEWTDPVTRQPVKTRFYDGLAFHRVIDGFVIQGGDPLGNGTGGPGYRFGDEFHPKRRHEAASRAAVDRLIDATVRRGGKVHLAKDQVLTPEQFHRVYPRYRDLVAIKRRLDPDGLFMSDLARRVGICPVRKESLASASAASS